MANIAHATLTGASLHEPKGVETATTGQVYVADGLASGAWTTVTGLSFTGLIAPFVTPIAPSGWYELDGSTISNSTDAALYNVMTIQGTGSGSSGIPGITGLASTTNFKVGYYIFGTGIPLGTTILTIDSPNDVTMSANATTNGSRTIIVSPWQLTSGGVVLPDMTTAGRFPRSRTSANRIGLTQASQNKTHTHGFTTNTDGGGGTTSGQSQDHTHLYTNPQGGTVGIVPGGSNIFAPINSIASGGSSQGHTHTIPNHAHSGTTGNGSVDGSEVRPESIIFMWCVKR